MQLFAVVGALATTALFLVQSDCGGWVVPCSSSPICAARPSSSTMPICPTSPAKISASRVVVRLGHGLSRRRVVAHCQSGDFPVQRSGCISSGLAVRINLASAGLWWLGWSVWTWLTLRSRHVARSLPAGENLLSIAFKQLSGTMETPPGPDCRSAALTVGRARAPSYRDAAEAAGGVGIPRAAWAQS